MKESTNKSLEVSMIPSPSFDAETEHQESLTTRTVATTTRCLSDKASISTCTSSFTETSKFLKILE